jgi:dipeptidyl aminopeptidase/acylaminoacyl peptidase
MPRNLVFASRFVLLTSCVAMLLACGGGGASDGGSTTSTNTAPNLAGTMFYSFNGRTKKVDLATSDTSEFKIQGLSIPGFYFALSSDNKTLYFIDDKHLSINVNSSLQAVDLATGVAKVVFKVNEPVGWSDISVSPDGNNIAMVRSGSPASSRGVYIFDKTAKQLSYFAARAGDYSSVGWTDDNRLLYTHSDGFYLTNPGDVANSKLVAAISNVDTMALSPDGNKIAYSAGNHIWTMNIDGTNPQQITISDNGEYRPRWSPDGKYIVFKTAIDVVSTGPIPTSGTLTKLIVVPADGKQYELKKETFVGGGSFSTGIVGSNGVVLLKEKDTDGASKNLFADEFFWR